MRDDPVSIPTVDKSTATLDAMERRNWEANF